MRRRLIAWLVVSLSLASCDFQNNKQSVTFPQDDQPQGVGFDQVKTQVLAVSCLSCHSTQAPHLADFATAHAAAAAIELAVFVNKTMPQAGTLSPLQLSVLKTWIDEGAPELPPSSPEPSPSPSGSGPVQWSQLKLGLVDVSCAGCHFPANPQGIPDLTDQADFESVLGTLLYLTIVEKVSPMPPLPAQITDDQKRLLTEWVIDGQQPPLPAASPVPVPSSTPQPSPLPAGTLGVLPSSTSAPSLIFDIGYTAGTHHGSTPSASGTIKATLNPIHITSGTISVPISTMTTGNSQRDCHMTEALGINYSVSRYPKQHVCDSTNHLPSTGPDSVAYPNITLKLQPFTSPSGLKPGTAVDLPLPVVLSIHGVDKTMQIATHLAEDLTGKITVTGSFDVLLADHGIVVIPVVIITVADHATVTLNLTLEP